MVSITGIRSICLATLLSTGLRFDVIPSAREASVFSTYGLIGSASQPRSKHYVKVLQILYFLSRSQCCADLQCEPVLYFRKDAELDRLWIRVKIADSMKVLSESFPFF